VRDKDFISYGAIQITQQSIDWR